jgi:hypothetical protein
MPLYEVVLRDGEREEVRLTDRDPRSDGGLDIGIHRWRIVEVTEPATPFATCRLVAEPLLPSESSV